MRRVLFIASVLGIVATLCAPARAQQVVYDNGGYDGTTGYDITAFAIANNFTLSQSTTFNTIRFYMLDVENFSGTLTWFLHKNATNAGGMILPGPVEMQGTTSSISMMNTGGTIQNVPVYQLEFPVAQPGGPVTLGADTWWLRIKEGTATSPDDGTSVAWAERNGYTEPAYRSDADPVNPSRWDYDGFQTTAHMGFQLIQTAGASAEAPEPASLALLLLGSLSLVGAARRRSFGASFDGFPEMTLPCGPADRRKDRPAVQSAAPSRRRCPESGWRVLCDQYGNLRHGRTVCFVSRRPPLRNPARSVC
jgi:hypothetical protein